MVPAKLDHAPIELSREIGARHATVTVSPARGRPGGYGRQNGLVVALRASGRIERPLFGLDRADAADATLSGFLTSGARRHLPNRVQGRRNKALQIVQPAGIGIAYSWRTGPSR